MLNAIGLIVILLHVTVTTKFKGKDAYEMHFTLAPAKLKMHFICMVVRTPFGRSECMKGIAMIEPQPITDKMLRPLVERLYDRIRTDPARAPAFPASVSDKPKRHVKLE